MITKNKLSEMYLNDPIFNAICDHLYYEEYLLNINNKDDAQDLLEFVNENKSRILFRTLRVKNQQIEVLKSEILKRGKLTKLERFKDMYEEVEMID